MLKPLSRIAGSGLVLLSLLLTACSGKGPETGPASLAGQLVGHWSTPSDDHLYFGAIDTGSHVGSYILVHPDGKAFAHRYEIASDHPADRKLTINMLFASGDSRETIYSIAEDGRSMVSSTVVTGIETSSLLSRVDGATAPPQ